MRLILLIIPSVEPRASSSRSRPDCQYSTASMDGGTDGGYTQGGIGA